MNNLIESILEILTDNGRGITTKAMFALSLFVFALIVDNTFGFSYYYNIDSKINETMKLQSLIENPKLDSVLKNKLLVLQADVLTKKSIKDYFFSSFRNSSFATSNAHQNSITTNTATPIKNRFLFILSSVGFYILLIVCSPAIIFIGKDVLFKKVMTFIVTVSFLYVGCSIIVFLLNLIPVILNNPVYNYILNFLVQCVTVFFVYREANKNKVRRNLK